MLELSDIACGHKKVAMMEHVSLTVSPGEVVCLLGPNGCGKTTLLRAILGLHPLRKGAITFDGADMRSWPRARMARTFAYVPQAHVPPFPYVVEDVVLMGRTVYCGTFSAPSRRDRAIAHEVLESLGILALARRNYVALSGGERALVLIARALAQRVPVLILDEPTSHLDYANQVRILSEIERLAKGGMAVLMSTHRPDHALWVEAKVAFFHGSTLHVGDRRGSAITEEALRQIYGIETHILREERPDGRISQACAPGPLQRAGETRRSS